MNPHGRTEDTREANRESLRAACPDMQLRAEANLLASGSFELWLFASHSQAMTRLSLWVAGRNDLLPPCYCDSQMVVDSGAIWAKTKEWIDTERERLVTEWVEEHA